MGKEEISAIVKEAVREALAEAGGCSAKHCVERCGITPVSSVQLDGTTEIRSVLAGRSGRRHMDIAARSQHSVFLSVASFLEAFSERLCRVQIEHLDWRDFVGRYDSPSTFFYVDPPYDCSQAYQQAFSQSDHQALRDFLMACEGRWLLSYNDTDFIRDLYCGCHFEVFERKVPFNAQGSI